MEQIPLALRLRLAEISDRLAQINETMDMLGPTDKYPFRHRESVDALFREWQELHNELSRARAWRDRQSGRLRQAGTGY
jgi:hypothetical protein